LPCADVFVRLSSFRASRRLTGIAKNFAEAALWQPEA